MSASKKPSRGTCHWSSQKRLITQLTTTHTRIRVAPPSTIHLASHVIVVNTIQFFTSASAHSLIFGPLLILRLHRLPPNHTATPNLQLSRLKEVKSPMEMHIVEIGGKLCHYSLLNTCFIFTYFFSSIVTIGLLMYLAYQGKLWKATSRALLDRNLYFLIR